MSGKTLYAYVFFHMKGELKKRALQDLRLWGKARETGIRKGKAGEDTRDTLIDSRPEQVNARSEPGHGEGDLMIGKDQASAICVIVERKSRYIQMDVLRRYDAGMVHRTARKAV
jgi:IS30 family transposase